MLNYISSMFDEPKEGDEIDFVLPPLPKYIVLDLTLVTGMDTSTVDVFNDIKTICVSHGCKVFVAGLSPALRETLALCNFKPEAGERSKRNLRFFADLDTAMGKAEDYLVEDEMIQTEEVPGGIGGVDNEETSFQRALRAIDTQHSGDYAMDLSDLYPYTVPIELDIGECLYECEGGPVSDSNRGLFFIESGLMKIERDSGMSLTRGSMIGAPSSSGYDPRVSLSSMQARTGSMGKQAAMLKSGARRRQMETSIRLARLGPGWVVGTLEGVGATQYPSHHVAVSKCKMHHLPYHRIEEIEEKDPKLVLRLYKLLSHLMARRQELAIGQLVTLHSIMTAAPARKPIGRISSKAHLSFD
jgi:CRP-like cAMP-binding protein